MSAGNQQAEASRGLDEGLKTLQDAVVQGKYPSLVEQAFDLPTGFVTAKVWEETDDWALLIKCAVIVEASLGRLIATHFDSPEMTKHLKRLALDGRAGKVQLARDLDLIPASMAEQVRALAAIRNEFAHDLAMLRSDLASYLTNLQPNAPGARLWPQVLGQTDPADRIQFTAGQARKLIAVRTCILLLELTGPLLNLQNKVAAKQRLTAAADLSTLTKDDARRQALITRAGLAMQVIRERSPVSAASDRKP